jgi:hypothetical protein
MTSDHTTATGGFTGRGNTAPALFTLPPINGLSHAVLRRHFSQRENRTPDWVLGKLGRDPDGRPCETTRLTDLRWDVLLPAPVPDYLRDPEILCSEYERQASEQQSDLVVHCKLVVEGNQPLHCWWEASRAFAWETLVSAHQLAVIMVLHDPPATGYRNANQPHIHLMMPARQLDVRGFRQTSALARDSAHPMLAAAWAKVREARGLPGGL